MKRAKNFTLTETSAILAVAENATKAELFSLISGSSRKIKKAAEGWLSSAMKDLLANNKEALNIGLSAKNETWIVPFLQEKATENTGYFRENLENFAQSILDIRNENIGVRWEELADLIQDRVDITTRHAEFVARDQTLKMNGAINQERQKQAGITKYVWSTSKDDRVRESHDALEGDIFSWDNPPDIGHPSEDYLCRCVAVPILDDLVAVDEEG